MVDKVMPCLDFLRLGVQGRKERMLGPRLRVLKEGMRGERRERNEGGEGQG